MIQQMISLDPSSRPSFDAALASARGHVLPECFYAFLHGYVASISERATPFSFPSSTPAPPPTANSVKSKESATNVGPGEALPSDSDHRIDRIWEDYASVEPQLLPPPPQLDRTVTNVRVDYGTPVPASLNLHQVVFFSFCYVHD